MIHRSPLARPLPSRFCTSRFFSTGRFALAATLVCFAGSLSPVVHAESGESSAAGRGSGSSFQVTSEGEGDEARWNILAGDQVIATYHANLKETPAIYPLRTLKGLAVTRDFPMKKAGPWERKDHDHHRSLWFTHGLVNGVDFWLDDGKPHMGTIVHRDAATETTSDGVTLRTENDWLDADGDRVMKDQRIVRFHQSGDELVVDFGVRLIASDGPVVMGDTKEGTFAVRVGGSMKVDAGLGGQITNAEGKTNADAWSEASDWVDYSGPVLQERGDDVDSSKAPVAGVTILAHPKNDAAPTRWHVRDYGLFGANPFGRHHFGLEKYDGVEIPAGESLSLHYRVIVHDGGLDVKETEQRFRRYAETLPEPLSPPVTKALRPSGLPEPR